MEGERERGREGGREGTGGEPAGAPHLQTGGLSVPVQVERALDRHQDRRGPPQRPLPTPNSSRCSLAREKKNLNNINNSFKKGEKKRCILQTHIHTVTLYKLFDIGFQGLALEVVAYRLNVCTSLILALYGL